MFTSRPRILVIAAVLVASFFVWWIGDMRSSEPASSVAQNPAAGATQTSRQLRLGLNIAAGSALHAAALKFAEGVEMRSKGQLSIKVFPNQELGNDDQMLEMARRGELDLLLIPTAKLSTSIPAMQYADLPFYFNSREELYAMLDGEPGRMLLSKLGSIDLIGLTFWENGFKQFTANTPIHNPHDFANLRIRTMKSPLITDQFASMDAKPIPIDFHATYQALADGAVDGQENPLVAIVGMNFHKVQKHLTLSNHAYLGYVFSASKRAFESLSPDLRDVLQQTARDLTRWEREETARRETGFIEQIRAAGVEIHTLSTSERQQFSQRMSSIADKFGFIVGYDLLAKTEELRFTNDPSLRSGTEAPWIIGLDTDLSGNAAVSGGAIYRGMQLAVEDLNKKGGLLGRPLKILALDHTGNSQISADHLRTFAQMPSLLAVVGGVHSAVIVENLGLIHELKIPYLIPWASAPALISHQYQPSYTFRASINDAQVAPFLFEHAQKTGGRIAILLQRTAWGRSNEAALKPMIDKLPTNSTEIIWLDSSDANLENKLKPLDSDGFSAVVLAAYSGESVAVVQALARHKKKLPIFSHWGLINIDFFAATQHELEKVDLRFVQSIVMNRPGQRAQLLAADRYYRQRFGLSADQPAMGLIGTWQAYDLTQLLGRAVIKAKSSDRAAIRNALESLPAYAGVLRDYPQPFTRERHEAIERSPLVLARFNQRGQIVAAE